MYINDLEDGVPQDYRLFFFSNHETSPGPNDTSFDQQLDQDRPLQERTVWQTSNQATVFASTSLQKIVQDVDLIDKQNLSSCMMPNKFDSPRRRPEDYRILRSIQP